MLFKVKRKSYVIHQVNNAIEDAFFIFLLLSTNILGKGEGISVS